jgi:hypothetical protein
MKNIHILPTENPSSLFEIDGHLIINKEQLIQPKYYRNIYITNNEDINENDYIITKDGRLVQVSYLLSKDLEGASKVILTTDHDLFKDDVQAINDEFHDWFVKNPNCERVETYSLGIENSDTGESGHYKYEIIIPQEEPKQETLEEAIRNNGYHDQSIDAIWREGVHFGVKWQQEQNKKMYSDEDCYNTIHNLMTDIKLNGLVINDDIDLKKWFEQFKKK